MNENAEPSTRPESGPSPTSDPAFNWRDGAKRLLVCNPFFLGSAALLLFGINRLSADPNFFGDETRNLLFNFFALQFYEVLVVAAAIVLSRRRVWYDSALLVVLENGLVLVPFMLISQATLMSGGLSSTLALAGGLVAVGRFASVRRWFPEFNLPPRALLLGVIILAANVALPRIFRPLMEIDVENWRGPNLIAWYAVLPSLAAGANLLRRPLRHGGLNPERPWLPLFNYALWIAGSAVHVWCVAHICNLPFALPWLAPLALVAAWTMVNRLPDCLPVRSPCWEGALLLLTLGAPLLAFAESRLFVLLCALNSAAYLVLCFTGRGQVRVMAKHLAMAALALIMAGLPQEWARLWMPEFTRDHANVLAGTVYFVLLALRSARPEAGLFGALAVAVDAGWLARESAPHVAIQAGAMFLLMHSLRWRDAQYSGARFLRRFVAAIWTLDALAWTRDAGWLEAGVTGGAATLTLVMWGLAWWRRGEPGPRVVLVAAGMTMLSGPGNWFVQHASTGLISVVGSFVLFAAGIAVAWTRHRWERGSESTPKR